MVGTSNPASLAGTHPAPPPMCVSQLQRFAADYSLRSFVMFLLMLQLVYSQITFTTLIRHIGGFKQSSAELRLPCGLVCSRARLRCVRARLCGCCRARGVRVRFEMAWAGCACSSATRWWGVSCTVCSERALSPVCCACCPSAARARRCFVCATGCTSLSHFESLRQAGCLRPKAGGGCVRAWIVCDAVRGAGCRGRSRFAVLRILRNRLKRPPTAQWRKEGPVRLPEGVRMIN